MRISVHARGDPKIELSSAGGGLPNVKLVSAPVRMTDCPPYEGDYEVLPAAEARELPTSGLRMEENLTVLGIPYAEVSNEEGGLTVTIAS